MNNFGIDPTLFDKEEVSQFPKPVDKSPVGIPLTTDAGDVDPIVKSQEVAESIEPEVYRSGDQTFTHKWEVEEYKKEQAEQKEKIKKIKERTSKEMDALNKAIDNPTPLEAHNPTRWKDIIRSPLYKRLPAEDKIRHVNRYFDNVIAPNIPEEDREYAKRKWQLSVRNDVQAPPDWVTKIDKNKLYYDTMEGKKVFMPHMLLKPHELVTISFPKEYFRSPNEPDLIMDTGSQQKIDGKMVHTPPKDPSKPVYFDKRPVPPVGFTLKKVGDEERWVFDRKKAKGEYELQKLAEQRKKLLEDSKLTNKALSVTASLASTFLGLAESMWRTPDDIARARKWVEKTMGLPKWAVKYDPVGKMIRDITGTDEEGKSVRFGTTAMAEYHAKARRDAPGKYEMFKRAQERGQKADEAFKDALKGKYGKLLNTITDVEAWAGFTAEAAPSLYLAYKSGGSSLFIAWLEGMEYSNNVADFERRTGKKIDPAEFFKGKALVMSINTWLEKTGLGAVTKSGRRLTFSSILRAATTEGGTEGIQEFNQNFAIKSYVDPKQELTGGILPAMMGGAAGGGVARGIHVTAGQKIEKQKIAEDKAEAIEYLDNLANKNKPVDEKSKTDLTTEETKSHTEDTLKVDPEKPSQFTAEELSQQGVQVPPGEYSDVTDEKGGELLVNNETGETYTKEGMPLDTVPEVTSEKAEPEQIAGVKNLYEKFQKGETTDEGQPSVVLDILNRMKEDGIDINRDNIQEIEKRILDEQFYSENDNEFFSRIEQYHEELKKKQPDWTDYELTQKKGIEYHEPRQQVKPEATKESINKAANEAATSPKNEISEPTEAQKKAGNYKKGHIKAHGMDIAIENPKGSVREGTNPDGKPWKRKMRDHYGYIKRSEGKDGDQVDVFIGKNKVKESSPIYVVDQTNPETGKFDEHKVIMGANNVAEAKRIYRRNYEKGWKGLGAITKMAPAEFKEWLKIGNTKKAVSPAFGRQIQETKDAQKIRSDQRQVEEAPQAQRREERRPESQGKRREDLQQPAETRAKASEQKKSQIDKEKAKKYGLGFQFQKEEAKETKGTPAKQVQDLVNTVVPRWQDTHDQNIEAIQSFDQLPDEIKNSVPENERKTIKAVHSKDRKKIYMVSDNIDNLAEAQKALLHELVGHMGMQEMMGDAYDYVVNGVMRMNKVSSQARKVISDVKKRYPDLDKYQQAEEVIAVMAEQGINNSVMERAIAAIKRFIRSIGFRNLKLSKSELRMLIAESAGFVERGGRTGRWIDTQVTNVMDEKGFQSMKDVLEYATADSLGKEPSWKKRSASKLKTFIKKNGMAMLTRQHWADIAHTYLPSAKKYNLDAQRMEGFRTMLNTSASQLQHDMWDWQKKNPEQADTWAYIIHNSTLAGVDVSESRPTSMSETEFSFKIGVLKKKAAGRAGEGTAKFMEEIKQLEKDHKFRIKEKQKYWDDLRKDWNKLSKEGKNFYIELRNFYADRSDMMEQAIIDRIERSKASKKSKRVVIDSIREQFEGARVEGPYFPLARFGDFWIHATKKPGMYKEGSYTEKTFKESRDAVMDKYVTGKKKKKYVKDDTAKFMLYENEADLLHAKKQLEKEGYSVRYGKKLENVGAFAETSEGFVAGVMTEIDKVDPGNPANEKIKDAIYQSFLATLPDASMRKHFMHRGKVAGYSSDVVRAFANQAFHGSYQIGRIKYMDVLETHLNNMKKEIQSSKQPDPVFASMLYDEAVKRQEWVINPQSAKWASQTTAFAFTFFLGLTPAAAAVNLSQNALVAYPILMARYGVKNATREFLKAGAQYTAGGAVASGNTLRKKGAKALNYFGKFVGAKINEDTGATEIEKVMETKYVDKEKDAYNQLVNEGVLEKTLAHDMAAISEHDSRSFNPGWEKAMHFLTFQFHHAERFNRETTAMAAYRLAKAKYTKEWTKALNMAGKSPKEVENAIHEKAVNEARDVVYETHFDYSNANKARFMQGNAARVLLIFRQYSLNMTYLLLRNMYVAFKDPIGKGKTWASNWFTKEELQYIDKFTKEEKSLARKTLFGVLGMHALAGGATAMPLWWFIMAMGDLLFRDLGDDETHDTESEIKDWIVSLFGKEETGKAASQIATKGLFNFLTGWEGSSRVSLSELWFRGSKRELEPREQFAEWLKMAAGPVGGIAEKQIVGFGEIWDGNLWKGVEKMIPKGFADPMKAYRYFSEGALTRKGDPIMKKEEFTAGELFGQSVGFSIDRLNRHYERNNVKANIKKRLTDKKTKLIRALYQAAIVKKDKKKIKQVLQELKEFKKKYRAYAPRDLHQSLRQMKRRSKETKRGFHEDKRLKHTLKDKIKW